MSNPPLPLHAPGALTRRERQSHYLRWLAGVRLLSTALLASCSNRTELDDLVAGLTSRLLNGEQIAVTMLYIGVIEFSSLRDELGKPVEIS